MISDRFLRESEVASSNRNANKSAASEQKLPRMKTKALGDVQNTLHSRTSNFLKSNTNSAVKGSVRASVQSKSVLNDSISSHKNAVSGKKINVTPIKSAKTLLLSTPGIDDEMFETHNHILCEKGEQSYINDYLKDYKFTEKQMNNLARSVKISMTPLSIHLFEPCSDIEIPTVKKFEERNFSVSDILSDLVAPEVPAPLEAL